MKFTPEEFTEGVPAAFLKLPRNLPRALERRLGYHGQSRFVFFYYEAMGEQVVWNDGGSYGFGCGAWGIFMHQIAPLAKRHGVSLGSNDTGNTHVLLIDRQRGVAYFVEEWEAERFLATTGRAAA